MQVGLLGADVGMLNRLTSTVMVPWNGMSSRPSSLKPACTAQKPSTTPSISACNAYAHGPQNYLRLDRNCLFLTTNCAGCPRYHPLGAYMDLSKHFAPVESMTYFEDLDKVC